ncbi:MAG: hypothetical protein JWM68_4268 [Verrucomicrobiales bacterium]|nr:hypothetical protein [Verrucomicrobiales bacterium]
MKHFFPLTGIVVAILFANGLVCSGQVTRVTAKVKQQNADHNAAIDSAGGTSTKPAAAKAPAAPAKKDPIPDLATAEKVLKYQLNVVKQAKAKTDLAKKSHDTLHATYKGKNLDEATYATVMKRYEAADKEVAAADTALTTARGAFDILFGKYKGYGGTNDYRAQLP